LTIVTFVTFSVFEYGPCRCQVLPDVAAGEYSWSLADSAARLSAAPSGPGQLGGA
jgi:hypothetical protein